MIPAPRRLLKIGVFNRLHNSRLITNLSFQISIHRCRMLRFARCGQRIFETVAQNRQRIRSLISIFSFSPKNRQILLYPALTPGVYKGVRVDTKRRNHSRLSIQSVVGGKIRSAGYLIHAVISSFSTHLVAPITTITSSGVGYCLHFPRFTIRSY